MDFLVIDDEKIFRDATCLLIEEEGHYAESAESGEVALRTLREQKFDAVLLDVNLGREQGLDILRQILTDNPNLPVVMCTAQGTVTSAVEAMRRGALDFLEKPFTEEQFHLVLARVQRFNQLNQDIERLEERVKETTSQNPELLLDFASTAMREIMDVLLRAAKTQASILLTGESGTGKSVVARAIHERSLLASKPFITVSCPSLSRELLESDLFGHVKGAFTGAVKDHWGKVKAASGGTLFLDEIGDLPLEIQPKLLRLLQEREYERLGENISRKADVRIIAATNRDLKKRMAEGLFREDLFFRLNVITLDIPPLRARAGDVDRFAAHYLRHFATQAGRPPLEFSAQAVARMRSYSWPGNLRELRNAIERAVILAKGEQIACEDLPLDLAAISVDGNSTSPQLGDLMPLDKVEELHIRKILDRTSSIAEAARILEIDDATIYRKRKKLGLD
jgi:NtrC-family two-component system response regulator AlgB